MVNTVLGPISADDLGITLIHEHFALAHEGERVDLQNVPYDRTAVARTCAQALDKAKAHGLRTTVDATPIDLGRDTELQKRVAWDSGINVVSATGFYMDVSGANPSSQAYSRRPGPTEIYETLMTEITVGIGDTGVKAGVIKVATSQGRISPYEESVLRAAARVQKETGTPIITHTEGGTMGPEQADIFMAEGADPSRVMIGHMGGSTDLRYHASVLDRGVFVGFDRMGLELQVSDKLSIACILGLIGTGFAERILLSHDCVPVFIGEDVTTASLAQVLPNWHYGHLFANVIPTMKAAGVTSAAIDTMIIDNPRRLLA